MVQSFMVCSVKTSFYQYSMKELQSQFDAEGFSTGSASLVYNWYYKKNKRDFCSHHHLAKRAQQYLLENFDFSVPQIDFVQEAKDKTVKFLFRLSDGRKVETVLIPFHEKYTICLSSQVGCAMNCAFCFTGTQGFTRHLKTEEIVGQFLQAQTWLTTHRPYDDRILNIVYMGQGEPLHNFDAVKQSAEIFLSQHGLSLADHKITVSTSGYLPGLQRWKAEMPSVNIALSLHSPFTEKRNQLIPINRKFPLHDVLEVIRDIPKGDKRFITFEYLLIKGFNDSEQDAITTGQLLKEMKSLINLIPFNPFPGSKFERPELESVYRFKDYLAPFNIPTMIRTTKGDDILAACGQLKTEV